MQKGTRNVLNTSMCRNSTASALCARTSYDHIQPVSYLRGLVRVTNDGPRPNEARSEVGARSQSNTVRSVPER